MSHCPHCLKDIEVSFKKSPHAIDLPLLKEKPSRAAELRAVIMLSNQGLSVREVAAQLTSEGHKISKSKVYDLLKTQK